MLYICGTYSVLGRMTFVLMSTYVPYWIALELQMYLINMLGTVTLWGKVKLQVLVSG